MGRVVCDNGLTDAQLMRVVEKNDLVPPRDLPVVGYDDVKYATLLTPPPTRFGTSSRRSRGQFPKGN